MIARHPRTLTPELVEQRLSELQQLSRLGASLAEAELPPIDRRVLARRSLAIVARAITVAPDARDARDVRVHVAPPASDRHLGWMLDTWVDAATGVVLATGLAVLVAVMVDDAPVDALPRGRGGIVTLRCLVARPACLDALAVLAANDPPARLWLCASRDRARTRW